jgi:broad specificity phosphatase PhoE
MHLNFSSLVNAGKIDIYFVRHGKSEGNHKDIVQGRLDFPLSSLGREQAKLTGAWFADKGIRLAFCTPLLRGLDTARVICAEAGASEPQPLEDLVELDTGVFTGMTLEEARLSRPEIWPRFLAKSWEGVEGAEPIKALRGRAVSAWRTLISRAAKAASAEQAGQAAPHTSGAGASVLNRPAAPAGPAETGRGPFAVLAVAHAGILQWLIKATFGAESWFPLLAMGDCGIYHFSVEGTVTRWEKFNFQVPGVTGKR